jgi:hypothetical protein
MDYGISSYELSDLELKSQPMTELEKKVIQKMKKQDKSPDPKKIFEGYKKKSK